MIQNSFGLQEAHKSSIKTINQIVPFEGWIFSEHLPLSGRSKGPNSLQAVEFLSILEYVVMKVAKIEQTKEKIYK